MAEAWPIILLPSRVGFILDNPSRGGGPSIDGREQTVASLAMRWRASVSIPIRTDAQVLAARALFAKLQGRANAVAVPAFDGRRAPWPLDPTFGVKITPARAGGTGYPDVPAAAAINAVVEGDTAAGSTSIQVQVSQGGVPQAGQYFGVGERLHIITGVTDETGGQYQLAFLPPLRAQASNGATVIFAHPVCTMKQASDAQGLPPLDMLRFGDMTLEFVEDF